MLAFVWLSFSFLKFACHSLFHVNVASFLVSFLSGSVSVVLSLMKCEQQLTSPTKLLTSVAFDGVFALLTASTLDLPGYIPLSVRPYPANVSYVV